MILPTKRSAPRHRFAVLSAAIVVACACAPEVSENGRATTVVSVGAELMTQQAPQEARGQGTPADLLTGGWYCPRYRTYGDYGEVRSKAGTYPFYWTRAVYSGNGWRNSWAVDFPKSDQQFLIVIRRLVRLNAYDCENPVMLSDPDLRRFPLIYMLEVGGMYLTEDEVEGLRGYMEAGGFVIVDDFWGPREWDNFLWNMSRVFPDKTVVDIGLDHPIYSTYYDIDEVVQVPAVNNIYRRTECNGCFPQVRGMYDDDGRLMMMINFNTDLGDAWEWAEQPSYPLDLSTYAYQMGANMIVYAMSH
jgi:hypothetical protein